MDAKITILNPVEFKNLMKEVLLEHEAKKADTEIRLYTRNQVAKLLKKSHRTITKLVRSGLITTTKSGLITEQGINEYLNRRN